MENKKYTIKYSSNTQLNNSHPLIKTSIRKAVNTGVLHAVTTCLTFSLVVSGVGYAQALNKTNTDNSSDLNKSVNTSSPHYIAIENFQTQKESYWDLSNLNPDRVFYVDLNKLVDIPDEEYGVLTDSKDPVFNFSDMSIQYSQNNAQTSEPEQNSSSLEQISTYRYANLIHLTDSERHVVESIVAGESGNQPFVGKKLVAQAIYNGMLRDNMSPSQVRKQYSYSGYKDIDEFEKECLKAYGNTIAADECRQAVKEIFDEYSMPVDDFVLFFYAPAHSKGTWHETAKTLKPISYVKEDGSVTNYIGGHKFFALKDEPVINYTREG